MFAYCGNNPVVRSDEEGTFFFTVLGAVIGSAVGALDAWLLGESYEDIARSAKAGAVSGAIAGAGVDIGVLVIASGGTAGVALGAAASSGAVGGALGVGVATDWTADPMDYMGAAVVGGTMNVLSLGTAPINGEIVKGTLSQMVDNIFFECSYKIGSLIENTIIGTIIAETGTLLTRAVTST